MSGSANRRVRVSGERRAARSVQDLVGVGVPNPREQARVGQRALQGVVLAAQRDSKGHEVRLQHLDASTVVLTQRVFALGDVQRCAPCGASFRE